MSVVDEDTVRAVDAGRETALGMLSDVQRELKKVFVVFLVGFLGTMLALRWWVWDYLEAVVVSQLPQKVAKQVDVIARTPFDVILLQFKIGLFAGLLLGAVAGLVFARHAIFGRMEQNGVAVTRGRVYSFIAVSLALAGAGIAYAYLVFFPLMFKMLAQQAWAAGAKPSYGIVHLTEFMFLLTVSFGLAAQLPLVMGVLSYSELIPYETFRDKWRYAVLLIFVFGAVASPPDPFTQVMWALPLCALYAFSLGVAKVVTNIHRGGAAGSPVEPGAFRRKGYQVLGIALVAGIGTALALYTGQAEVIGEAVLARVPDRLSVPFLGDVLLPTRVERGGPMVWLRSALTAALLVGGVVLVVHLVGILRMPVVSPEYSPGDGETDVDLRNLDNAALRRAPDEAFASLSEEEAVEIAGEAMESGDDERGRLILERWERAQSTAGDAAEDVPHVDFRALDAEGVAEAPAEAFTRLTEDEAVEIAGEAMEVGDEEKGRLLLQRWEAATNADEPAMTRDPADLDLRELDAGGVERAPPEAFAALSEDEAVDIAGEAMEAGDERKGQLLLQRWDEVNEARTAAGEEEAESAGPDDPAGDADGFDDIFSDTTSGMLGSFADEDRDENEIGGYIYDIGFILDSLKSRLFIVAGTFMAVFTAMFVYLYAIGVNQIMEVFISEVPQDKLTPGQRAQEATDVIIALHPVEVLIFMFKFSGLVAILVTTPVLLYFVWPVLQERGIAPGGGDRWGFLVWGYVFIVGTLTGAIVGFFGIAPTVISYLITDAASSGMVVSYRIKSLLWVVFYMTLGFGFFLNIPIAMVLFHISDLVPYRLLRGYWRHFVLVDFVLAALITPGGVLTMLVFAIPVAVAYALGLGLLWTLTAPRRLLERIRRPITG